MVAPRHLAGIRLSIPTRRCAPCALRQNKTLPAGVRVIGLGCVIIMLPELAEDLVLESVDLPFERFLELDLKLGEEVFVSPKRVRVFSPDDYVI